MWEMMFTSAILNSGLSVVNCAKMAEAVDVINLKIN